MNKIRTALNLIPLFGAIDNPDIDIDSILNKHGIVMDNLSGFAHFPREVEISIIEDLIGIVKDPLLGFKVGQVSTFASFGIFSLLLMNSPDITTAVKSAEKFQQLSPLLTDFEVLNNQDTIEIRLTTPEANQDIKNFIVDRDVSGCFRFINELSIDLSNFLIEGGISRPLPDKKLLKLYKDTCQTNLKFGEPYTWITLDKKILNSPMPHGNKLSHKLYLTLAQQWINTYYPESEDFIFQVNRIITSYDKIMPTTKDIALKFGISERTFQRRLEEAGVSYRSLIDNHKKAKAINLLINDSLTIEKISSVLGYAEPAAFMKAFKRWTGTTPKKYLIQSK